MSFSIGFFSDDLIQWALRYTFVPAVFHQNQSSRSQQIVFTYQSDCIVHQIFVIRRVRKDIIKFASLQPRQGFGRVKAQHFDAVCKAAKGCILADELLRVMSMKTADAAPRLSASSPRAPVPAKDIEDSGTAQAAAVSRMLKRLSRVRSSVGRSASPSGLQDPSSGTAGYDSHRITCSYIVNYTRFLLHINLFFLNSFDLQFLAVHEADDVVFMAHDDQQGCQQAENRQRQRFVEKEHGNGHQDGRYDGTEGDDARQGDDDGPDAEDDKRFPRGQEQDDAQARGAPLPPLNLRKIEHEWPTMASRPPAIMK